MFEGSLVTRYVIFSLEMHQPYRIKKSIEHGSSLRDVLDRELDKLVLGRVASKSYEPVLRIISEEFDDIESRYGYKPSINISVSGTLLEQLIEGHGEIIDLMRRLVSRGYLELVAEPYYHSLASEISRREFEDQMKQSMDTLRKIFNYSPRGAVNTEMIYRNEIGCWIRDLGFRYSVVEGVERLFGTRDPNYLYVDTCGLLLFARHYRLSDDVAFRFSLSTWDQYPLTADKYASWIRDSPGDFVLIYMDFETFGEHHWPESGILEFLRHLPRELSKRDVKMISFSEASEIFRPVRVIDVRETISWADERKDLSAWLSNELQRRAFELYKWVGEAVLEVGDEDLVKMWRILGEADHYHYMYYEPGSPWAVHEYFSYHDNPYAAFDAYVKSLMILYAETVSRRSSLQKSS